MNGSERGVDSSCEDQLSFSELNNPDELKYAMDAGESRLSGLGWTDVNYFMY